MTTTDIDAQLIRLHHNVVKLARAVADVSIRDRLIAGLAEIERLNDARMAARHDESLAADAYRREVEKQLKRD